MQGKERPKVQRPSETVILSQKISSFRKSINVLNFLQNFCIAITLSSLWYMLAPALADHVWYLGLAIFLALILLNDRIKKKNLPAPNKYKLLLDMTYANQEGDPYGETPNAPDDLAWQKNSSMLLSSIVKEQRQTLFQKTKALFAYALVMVLSLFLAKPPLQAFLNDVNSVVLNLQKGAQLKIIEGAINPNDKGFKLNASQNTLVALLSDNMIEVQAQIPAHHAPPFIELRKISIAPPKDKMDEKADDKPTVLQRFQMMKKPQSDEQSGLISYQLRFSVAQPSTMVIPDLFGEAPVATLRVEKLPVPEVTMRVATTLKDPWPDNIPLPLQITAQGQNPLRMVNVIITVGKKSSKELVNNIISQDTHEIDINYDLLLEPYNEQDISEVQIVAEVIDRSLPQFLVGYSEPIVLTIASSYGRYRQTLASLKEIKQNLDEKIEAGKNKFDTEIGAIADKALEQSVDSPFFDGIDRMQIMEFVEQVHELTRQESPDRMIQLSESLNFFLFEHEILDDRERDRDFFVAARSFSRLLEKQSTDAVERVLQAEKRLHEFLDERTFRWKLRLEYLDKKHHPKDAANIVNKKPFHSSVSSTARLKEKKTKATQDEALHLLLETVSQYKSWITELEEKEDKARAEEAAKRQEGLASTQDALRELQRSQAKVSQALDKAAEQDKEELKDNWPMTRMEQSSNIEATIKVEAAMRSLSPLAAMRIKAAMDSMEKTREQGNEGKFVEAESASDQAGRLLNQAQNAAEQAQRQQGQRGRRRRVTGDSTYGTNVIGDIEIKRDYEVDQRYREDILRDVSSSQYLQEEENRDYLNQYLRKVVR